MLALFPRMQINARNLQRVERPENCADEFVYQFITIISIQVMDEPLLKGVIVRLIKKCRGILLNNQPIAEKAYLPIFKVFSKR